MIPTRIIAPLFAALTSLLVTMRGDAQVLFGTNSGTFADYLQATGMEAVPLRSFGTAASPFGPDTSVRGNNGSLVKDFGTVTYAMNYPSGTYLLQYTSPSPVTMNWSGFFTPGAVTRTGTLTTQIVAMTHDNGNLKAGMGWFTSGGVSASNPVSNLTLSLQGKVASNLAAPFSNMMNGYNGVRWMNNLEINNNVAVRTAADLVPSGFNAGQNSYADIVTWTNQRASQRAVMINIPIHADSSFIAGIAKTMSGLVAGKQLIVEYGNEDWNYGFTQGGTLSNDGTADSRVTAADGFGKGAQETGLRAAAMMQTFRANYTGPATLSGFLGSQGANQYFVDQSKQAIKNVYGAAFFAQNFQYQGISVYPGDGITGASSKQDLYNQLEADLTRQTTYLKNDVADAAKDGLKELVYEWSPNGYLTRGGVSQSIIDAFRADPISKQLTLDTWAAISGNIGGGGIAFDFDITGDGWSTQIDPLGAHEQEQLAIDSIAAALPEPSGLVAGVTVGLAAVLSRRRRAA